MATIKSFTDLQQSLKLAEFLPIESADMRIGNYVGKHGCVDGTNVHYYHKSESFGAPEIIPCWSLAALFDVLPKIINHETLFVETSASLWHVGYRGIYTVRSVNLVDACYKMVVELHELKML